MDCDIIDSCDKCAKPVCSHIDCENGFKWDEDGTLVCFDHIEE